MARNPKLQQVLTELTGYQVYFQPPTNIQMSYPCIRMKLSKLGGSFADNKRFIKQNEYTITLMTYDPEDPIIEVINDFEYSKFNTHYSKDNLNHYVYTINY